MSLRYDSNLDTAIIAPYLNLPIPVADFENEAWHSCQPVEIKRYWSGETAPVNRRAEVRVCWSEEALHVRFRGNQGEPLVVSAHPVTDRKTLGLWDRDVCEIFIAPDPANPLRYFEFEAAPTGEWVDLGILITPLQRETQWDYASGMTVAASVENGQIIIALRIPWSESIPKPYSGKRWRVNLFRCQGPESRARYLAWQPTRTAEPNFHVPEAFGYLLFA